MAASGHHPASDDLTLILGNATQQLAHEYTSDIVAIHGRLRDRGTEAPPASRRAHTHRLPEIDVFGKPVQPLQDSQAGSLVALVGENGSGKTTLAKLLAGLYTPSSGNILWDDTDISGCDPDLLRRSIALIFQELGQYFMTAGENIGLGDVARINDTDAIVEAAVLAQADKFIAELPKGYDNLLGSEYFGGANLSLGQWQRMALARAFFRDAPFVILDEPTASLDPRAEAALFENVRTLYQGRAVLLISHRFSSVRSADRIYVMDSGFIVENGTHEELMDQDGLYAELFELQAAAYDPGRRRR